MPAEPVLVEPIPDSLRLMLHTVRRFVRRELEPVARQLEEQDAIPEPVVQRMRELGLFGLAIPEPYGGLGLGALGEGLVHEELSRVNAEFRPRVATHHGPGSHVLVPDGSVAQKDPDTPRPVAGPAAPRRRSCRA